MSSWREKTKPPVAYSLDLADFSFASELTNDFYYCIQNDEERSRMSSDI